jgi:hypothetical protein
MAESVLMDNDVILKTCCYGVVDEVLGCVSGEARTIHVLGVVRYVLGRAIAKRKNISDRDGAASRFSYLLGRVALIEPDNDELSLAADFEHAALSLGVDLDGGESQLLAVLIRRSSALLLTGDKRAIRAIEPVLQASDYRQQVEHRIACLEQIMMAVVGRYGAETIHQRVCSEAAVDKSLAVCFSCCSGTCNLQSIIDGLASYIRDLRRDAQWALVVSDDLSAVVS